MTNAEGERAMTIDEFLAVLREQASAHRWILGPICLAPARYGIRTDDDMLTRQCPITFVAQVPGLQVSYTAGQQLGLSWADITEIVSAADAEPEHDPALRQALLEAVGLT